MKSKRSSKPDALFRRRRERTRFKLRQAAKGRTRLSVFRSSRHIYAQIIDDAAGRTLAAASTLDAGLKPNLKTGADTAAAKAVGLLLVDRGAYLYHGRIKALADAAREGGLHF
jgi:large subunit ribosomal protein L18